jgi:hypothetical protein
VNNGLSPSLGRIDTLSTLELVIDLPTGERLIRNCVAGDGQGGIFLTGYVPANAGISFARMNSDIVVNSSRALAGTAAEAAAGGGMLMYSCTARNWALTNNTLDELEAIRTAVDERSSFQCCYSGGEIFPYFAENGSRITTLQCSSYIICLL